MISDNTERPPRHAWATALGVVTIATVVTAAGTHTGPAAALAAAPATPTLYEQLRASELTPAGRLQGASFEVDRAELTFDDGELYLAAPVAGRSTAAVYLGKGRIRVQPPDAIERHQLDKYLDEPELDLQFRSLVMRFTDDTAERLRLLALPSRRPDARKANQLYRERQRKALEERLFNLDSRVLMDLADSRFELAPTRPGYFFAEVEAKGWFTYEVDPFRVEEVSIYKTHGQRRGWDRWSSFHHLADYPPSAAVQPDDGTESALFSTMPAEVNEQWRAVCEVREVRTDIAIDGNGEIVAVAELLVEPLVPTSVLRLTLSSLLAVEEIRWSATPQTSIDSSEWIGASAAPDEPHRLSGEAVQFVQEHVGRGFAEDRWEPRLTVLLPRRVAAGERLSLQVLYGGELLERLQNRDFVNRDADNWYPQHPHTRRSRFTTMFRFPERMAVATGGSLQSESVVDGTRIELRAVDEPVIGMSFQYGRLDVDEYTPAGLPSITVYSSPNTTGIDIGNRDRTRADILGSIELFTDYYGPPPFDHLVVTQTPTAAARSFHGFILLGFGAFAGMHTGEAELFRSHELAHQWWGNAVTWDSYHDQWMSEGFAQYSSALYALKTLGDEAQFDEMMTAWRKDILAKVDVRQRLGLRHYGFTREVLRKSDGSDSGPIWLGPRLASDKTPFDYRILVYEKGAYVLHMLRMMLLDWENDDDARFRQLMRDFHRRHRGATATTLDFLAAAERAAGVRLDWFFEQWVYGTAIPTYRPDLEAHETDSGWRLTGSVDQEDVPAGFRMPVPVRVRLVDSSTQVVVLQIDRSSISVDEPLRGEAHEIEFNPLSAVLATGS